MRNMILSILPILALLIYPLSLSAQNSFSVSVDVNGAAGDQAVTSVNMSADQVIAIQIFGTGIQNANGLNARFEYDDAQVVYEGVEVGDVLPNAQALPEEGTGFVEIGIASMGGQATVNSGLMGTVRFRTTAAFSGTAIRLVRAELSRGGQFETVTMDVRVELQSQAVTPDFLIAIVWLILPTFWRLRVSLGHVRAMGDMKRSTIWTAMARLALAIFCSLAVALAKEAGSGSEETRGYHSGCKPARSNRVRTG